MAGVPASVVLARALSAVELAYPAPGRAQRLAQSAIADADGLPEPVAVANHAIGMALAARGNIGDGQKHLRTAIELAEQANLPVRAAQARGSLAYLLTLTGRTADALGQLELAAAVLSGAPAARLQSQRALVLTEIGRFDEAAQGFADALDTLRRAGGDQLIEAAIRSNRSILAVQRRDWRAAAEDLDLAEALCVAAGELGMVGTLYHNRASAAALRGDVPAALAAFDEAAQRKRDSGRDLGLLPIERAETLLSVGLVAEARASAQDAVTTFAAQRNAVDLVQARLLLAEAALLDGDHGPALEQAVLARRSAARQQRPAWSARAGYVELRARWAAGERSEQTLRTARRVVAALTAAGWLVPAMDAQLIVARLAIHSGRPRAARAALAQVAEGRQDGPAALRVRAWHADALLRLSEGDTRGAEAALAAGMLVSERFRASLGATELRAHASGQAGELAATGVALAMESGTPESVLSWVERWRAGALMLAPARPPDDDQLAADLAELRQVVARIGAGDGEAVALLRRQAELEESVRRRAHHAAGARWADAGPLPMPSLYAALGERALIEYLAVEGHLHAVVVVHGTAHVVALGPVDGVTAELSALRYGLRKLAYATGTASSLAAASALVEHKAHRLDAVLLGPMRAELADRGLVIVPTGALHAMPWAALPSAAGRPVSVAPSAALWLRAAAPGTDGDVPAPAVLAAGPGLAHADAEVAALGRRYPDARRFTGAQAGVAAVSAAMDGARFAHLAAHGHFRADNPLFSSLLLADGPLTVYDLERLARPPARVVLSACDSGLPAVRPGDEILGLAGALLAIGTRSLVASVVPVPDDASRPLMVAMHEHLLAGLDPAAALARAAADLTRGGSPAHRVAAVGFLCFGAG